MEPQPCRLRELALEQEPEEAPEQGPPHQESMVQEEAALDRLVRGEPVIFVTGHCGNWEVLGYAMSLLGFPMAALARPLDNPLINEWLLGVREARGMQIITKWGATSLLPRLIEDGHAVGFIADQNAGDQGLFVPFFGRLASSYKTIGLLAMRYKVPIMAASARGPQRMLRTNRLPSPPSAPMCRSACCCRPPTKMLFSMTLSRGLPTGSETPPRTVPTTMFP